MTQTGLNLAYVGLLQTCHIVLDNSHLPIYFYLACETLDIFYLKNYEYNLYVFFYFV